MLLKLICNFIKISFYFCIGFGILGIIYGIINGENISTKKIKSYYPVSIHYNPFYINYYNYSTEYVNSISYSIVYFGIISFIIGLVLPSGILFLTISYFINKYN